MLCFTLTQITFEENNYNFISYYEKLVFRRESFLSCYDNPSPKFILITQFEVSELDWSLAKAVLGLIFLNHYFYLILNITLTIQHKFEIIGEECRMCL